MAAPLTVISPPIIMERFLCIHCHFYQPPRENPWLEAIELQDSAYPYHDWNERITAECYAPNLAARILGAEQRIEQIVNNYSRISFNFGPTLLSWMEKKRPDVYTGILAADRESQARFSGHGSALAQAYNHMILPLANRRDKETQVRWGIADFETRFGRLPEGMWLPETAVDIETLEVLADARIKFTILAPHQAKQVRARRRGAWKSVEGARIDPSRAYLCKLPSGKSITLFFYDGPIARAVAFDKLLASGEGFAHRLLSGFSENRKWPQLMHIATDGETYGHHFPHGDMALAYALHYIESRNLARLTNYGEFLSKFPPTHDVEIVDRTSWSCAHGVDRWCADCGCASGGPKEYNQQWRAPLRAALDWLRDSTGGLYEEKARPLLKDPWQARDAYIHVVLDRSAEDAFFTNHAARTLLPAEVITALKLLELQRHAMLMYTSCGWFFDELSRLETTQVIAYAARAMQLAQELFGDHLEQQFLQRMAEAHSNLPTVENGARLYQQLVKPAVTTLRAVAAHYAICSALDGHQAVDSIYCYDVERRDYRTEMAGRTRLAAGHILVRSRITREEADLVFALVHFGDHHMNAAVSPFQKQERYEEVVSGLFSEFQKGDMALLLRRLEQDFGGSCYSLKSLFRDEQRRILRQILGGVLDEAEASFRGLYESHAALMRFLADARMPLPAVLRHTAEFVLNSYLRRELAAEQLDHDRIAGLVESARQEGITLDAGGLGFVLQHRMQRMMDQLAASPDLARIQDMQAVVRLARSLSLPLNLWQVQNTYWRLMESAAPAHAGGIPPDEWSAHFAALGAELEIQTKPVSQNKLLAA